jgi:Holliday junction resolvasome RuvABC ATP-dependent DNA helicase subunit
MFDTLIGQDHIKRQLEFYHSSYQASGVTPFLMFNGAKGLGKTEFAKQFAKALKKPLLEINCSTIKNSKQFFEQIFIPVIMDNEITILFDEVHALPKDLVMAFLTVFNIDQSRRREFSFEDSSLEFNFEKQTYLFATTEPDRLFAPFKDRLTIVDFKPYTEPELASILQKKLDYVSFEANALTEISQSLRGNARSAVKRGKEIQMYCDSRNVSAFGAKEWKDLCGILDINASGLTNTEIEILRVLKNRGECTLGMLSAATGLSRTCIQRDSELYLLKKGFMSIDGKRKITSSGTKALAAIA